MMPFLILFALFIILPVLISFVMSFTNYNMIGRSGRRRKSTATPRSAPHRW